MLIYASFFSSIFQIYIFIFHLDIQAGVHGCPVQQFLPTFEFTLQYLPTAEKFELLQVYTFLLTGAKEPHNFFRILLDSSTKDIPQWAEGRDIYCVLLCLLSLVLIVVELHTLQSHITVMHKRVHNYLFYLLGTLLPSSSSVI